MSKILPQSLLALILAFAPVANSFAGERLGNGGDPRRLRAYRAMNYLWQVFWESDIAMVQAPEMNWIAGYGRGFRMLVEGSHSTWNDEQSDGSRNCVTVTAREKYAIELSWSYADCPARAADSYYVDQVLTAFFAPYSTDQQLKDRIAAVHAIADDHKARILKDSPAYRDWQKFFDASDLKKVDLMQAHLEEARAMALDFLTRNTPDESVFYDFESAKRVTKLMQAHGDQLRSEVKNSKVLWDANSESCAYTEPKAGSDIHFALGNCQEIRSVADLAWMLVHESTHHLGIEDEDTADQVATAYLAWGWWFDID